MSEFDKDAEAARECFETMNQKLDPPKSEAEIVLEAHYRNDEFYDEIELEEARLNCQVAKILGTGGPTTPADRDLINEFVERWKDFWDKFDKTDTKLEMSSVSVPLEVNWKSDDDIPF